MNNQNRREFLKELTYVGGGILTFGAFSEATGRVRKKKGSKMRFGLVTYLWGKDWGLAELIGNCKKAGILGVELRTEHAHGVESNLSSKERREVKKRFSDSEVELVGLGTNFSFHYADSEKVKKDIAGAQNYIKLSYDVGGSGVKVKPNDLPAEVEREKTINQIGRSLKKLGSFAADYGQEVRLEVHGQCSELPTIKAIMEIVEHPNVGVCWNCNPEDLTGKGLEYNFNLVKESLGSTVHIRELNVGPYPYQQLMKLLAAVDYDGWILLEARTEPEDRVKALVEQRKLWEQMILQVKA